MHHLNSDSGYDWIFTGNMTNPTTLSKIFKKTTTLSKIMLFIGLVGFVGVAIRQKYIGVTRFHTKQSNLPASVPFIRFSDALVVHALLHSELSEPFYDRERVDYSSRLVIYPRPSHARVSSKARIIFVAHIARSGTTLLCRLLEARGDVTSYREPWLLTRLLEESLSADCFEPDEFGLIKSVLDIFVEHAASSGRSVVLIKLPSRATRPAILDTLSHLCPDAGRVHARRPVQEVLRSLVRSSTPTNLDSESYSGVSTIPIPTDSRLERTLTEKQNAARRWASREIAYDDIVGDAQALSRVCRALALSPPTPRQLSRMALEQTVDAKTGELRQFRF